MATLKELAPAEKQKVAHLIKQTVEKEAAIRELEAALAEARAAAAAAADSPEAAARAAALEEQNHALALENTRCGLLPSCHAVDGAAPQLIPVAMRVVANPAPSIRLLTLSYSLPHPPTPSLQLAGQADPRL